MQYLHLHYINSVIVTILTPVGPEKLKTILTEKMQTANKLEQDSTILSYKLYWFGGRAVVEKYTEMPDMVGVIKMLPGPWEVNFGWGCCSGVFPPPIRNTKI